MERALRLVATGVITVAMHKAAKLKGKPVTILKTLNETTGRESSSKSDFSEAHWGKATKAYANSAANLSPAKINMILEEAKEFAKPICRRGSRAEDPIDVDGDDGRIMVDNSDTE